MSKPSNSGPVRGLSQGLASVTLHPFEPMMFNIRSLSAATTQADKADKADKAMANHKSYCSAPPLVLPPRPSRDLEARRPRAPIWLGKRELPSSEAETVLAINFADEIDVKPDVAKLAAATCYARPAAPTRTSPSTARRAVVPSVRMGMGTVTLTHPPVRPRSDSSSSGPPDTKVLAAAATPPPVQARPPPAAPAASANVPRKPGRPLGSKNRPRVVGTGSPTPPPTSKAAKLSARKTRENLSRE